MGEPVIDDRNQILQGYRGWLYRVAMSMTDRSHVDDLVQEGYIAMWRALGTYQAERGALPTWLTGAARLRMADIARGHGQPTGHERKVGTDRRRPGDTRPEVVGVLALDGMPDGVRAEVDLLNALDPSEGLELAYHRGTIQRVIGSLPVDQQRYVVMRFWLDMTEADIAPHVEGNVRVLWSKARVVLREQLADLAA